MKKSEKQHDQEIREEELITVSTETHAHKDCISDKHSISLINY